MKKKSASQSAFFNLRILTGLFMVLASVFMALLAFGVFSPPSTAQAQQHRYIIAPELGIFAPGFDCSTIQQLGIDRQENFRAGAIMMACGESQGGSPSADGASSSSAVSKLVQSLMPSPLFIGGSDVDVVLPDGNFPHVTQSESMEWCGANNTCVVNYNDSRTASSCYAGISYSTDNGTTWQHSGQQLCSGHGTNFGDPIVVYNARLNMWFAGDLATGCGGQGIGLWTSPDGITWTPGACAANMGGGAGDRESMWVDNNPSSPFYGRMYISFNNFGVGGGALQLVFSDNGTNWSSPFVTLNGSFIRDIQVTGDLQGSGAVYVASMNENGGGLGSRQNRVFRSTDGGVTWNSSLAGPTFFGPGRSACTQNSYFVCMFGTNNWRHMGWGEPAANGNVVSLDYAACGTNVACGGSPDHGDVYYIRSTDGGVNWGTPVKLNTDSGTAIQWQPSMATTPSGVIFASWYDGREANGGADLNCTAGSPTQNCYRRWGRISTDNGATWQPDDMVGRSLTPLPGQPDGSVQPNYQGDYDYQSSNGESIIGGWTDGRNLINNASQQDVFVNIVQAGPAVIDAVSRKTHDGAGTFDIEMPRTGSSGVECRSGGATQDYSLVVTFSSNVTVTGSPQAQVVSGVGCVGTGGVCDPNGIVLVAGNTVTVPLTNIADQQVINVQINGVNSASDQPAVNVNIPMGILIGDVNANRTVNASDVALTKSQVGQAVTSGNFREDVNASGTITATDVSIVKSDVGHSLP